MAMGNCKLVGRVFIPASMAEAMPLFILERPYASSGSNDDWGDPPMNCSAVHFSDPVSNCNANRHAGQVPVFVICIVHVPQV